MITEREKTTMTENATYYSSLREQHNNNSAMQHYQTLTLNPLVQKAV
jgi:hypothetical protein